MVTVLFVTVLFQCASSAQGTLWDLKETQCKTGSLPLMVSGTHHKTANQGHNSAKQSMFLGQYSSKCWGWKRRQERCLQPWWHSPKETDLSFPTGRRVIRSWQLSRQQKGGWEGVSDMRSQIELLVNQGNMPLHVPICTKRR